MTHTEFKERRRFPRFPVACNLMFTLNHDQSMLYQGTSQNLCAGGMYFTTNHLAKIGDHINIIFPIKDEDGEYLTVEGKVVRSKFAKTYSELFHVSIEFTTIVEPWVNSLPEVE